MDSSRLLLLQKMSLYLCLDYFLVSKDDNMENKEMKVIQAEGSSKIRELSHVRTLHR